MNRIYFETIFKNGNKGTAYICLADERRSTFRVYVNNGRNRFYDEFKTLCSAKRCLNKLNYTEM